MIIEVEGGYKIKTKDGKLIGTKKGKPFATREGAERREIQIRYFKNKKSRS